MQATDVEPRTGRRPPTASAVTSASPPISRPSPPGEPVILRAPLELRGHQVTQLIANHDAAVRGGATRIVVDLGGVDQFDSAGLAAVLEILRRGRAAGVEVRLRGLAAGMLDLFSLVSVERLLVAAAAPRPVGSMRWAGRLVLPQLEALGRVADRTRAVLRALFLEPLKGRLPRFDRTVAELDASAVGALPIAMLIAFLLGLILAMQAWVQLRVWGAELYLADMVGVSVVTEIGPLMTGIVLAARSGSADAARLGAMVVGEEVDALRQMAIDPERYLVVPKVLAAALAAVGVGLLFSVTAVCGGCLFAWAVAGIDPGIFRDQLARVLGPGDVVFACFKSLSFGTCVGLVACAEGLGVRGGSEGVGRATTRAVVLAVFLIIVLDAVFVTVQRMVLT
jgi:phospholipid/cholesterol/gamma-HCH transport system permease protein